MTIKCKFKDGSTGFIPNVMYHPACIKLDQHHPAELWHFLDDVNDHLEEAYGMTCNDIISAEAPISLYRHCEGDEPWKHFGLLSREIRYNSEIH